MSPIDDVLEETEQKAAEPKSNAPFLAALYDVERCATALRDALLVLATFDDGVTKAAMSCRCGACFCCKARRSLGDAAESYVATNYRLGR